MSIFKPIPEIEPRIARACECLRLAGFPESEIAYQRGVLDSEAARNLNLHRQVGGLTVNARPRDWHRDEGLVSVTPVDSRKRIAAIHVTDNGRVEDAEWMDDDEGTDPRPGTRLAAIVTAVLFVAIIAALMFAIGYVAHDSTGRVEHAVSKARPGVLWMNPYWMSDLLDWLR